MEVGQKAVQISDCYSFGNKSGKGCVITFLNLSERNSGIPCFKYPNGEVLALRYDEFLTIGDRVKGARTGRLGTVKEIRKESFPMFVQWDNGDRGEWHDHNDITKLTDEEAGAKKHKYRLDDRVMLLRYYGNRRKGDIVTVTDTNALGTAVRCDYHSEWILTRHIKLDRSEEPRPRQFKVGDKVRVVAHTIKGGDFESPATWYERIPIGTISTVVCADTEPGSSMPYEIKTLNGKNSLWVAAADIELVEEEDAPRQFKVGDRVRVVAHTSKSWAYTHFPIGSVARIETVEEETENPDFCISNNDCEGYWVHPADIELIEEETIEVDVVKAFRKILLEREIEKACGINKSKEDAMSRATERKKILEVEIPELEGQIVDIQAKIDELKKEADRKKNYKTDAEEESAMLKRLVSDDQLEAIKVLKAKGHNIQITVAAAKDAPIPDA